MSAVLPFHIPSSSFRHSRAGFERIPSDLTRTELFRQPFVPIISCRLGVLGAFFVVDHQVHRHLGLVGPEDFGRTPAVADEITLGAWDLLVDQFRSSPSLSAAASCNRVMGRNIRG